MTPTVSLKPGRARSARQRHPWIFAGALQHVPGEAADGSTVRVVDEDGQFVAWGYLNRASQIAVRLLSWDEAELPDESLLFRRLQRALTWRRRCYGWPPAGAARLAYAESDGLPGLIVDRYADWLVVQFLTLGSERWREPLIDWLVRELTPRGIYERSDVDVRQKEGLDPRSGPLWGEAPPPLVEIAEHDCRFLVDLAHGQKTGFYLDQRVNRQHVAAYSPGREVLDAFAYSGGFGICAARAGASEVWYVDSSADALRLAQRNAELNGLPAPEERFLQRDVFQLLREYCDRARRFDVIVLDPPKFAYAQSHVERACRGYKDINRLAMQLLRPDGILATFSCSGAVGVELFQKVIFAAAVDARRDVQIVQVMGQAPDHPVLVHFPEGAYLKGFICRVS
ncbi:MAG: class I SAM-dependent rRNA methyltransferase [Anaerolineae bacterium]|nr:class I SAM-dependent rRNA methyltransferase [Anaerolineae bacterium]